MAETANLIVALGLKDGLSAGLGRATAQLKGLEQAGYRIGRGLSQVGSGLDRLLTRGAIAAGAALTGVVTTAISFEDAFAGVRKTVDATSGELDDLRQGFKDLTREIPLSFEELSKIGATAGALGIAKGDILDFTKTVALLGVTTDVTTDQAATSLGQLANVLNLTADDFDNFGATLVDLGNKGASTESQILELASRAGAGAHLIGIANDQTLGWASSVANLGIEVEAGGTALQKFFLDTLRNIQDDDTLQVMADTAGLTGAAFKTAFETDASGALTTFITGLGKLSEAEQLAVLDALGFSDQRITRTLLGLAGNVDNLTTSLDIAGDAWKANTALTTEAQKRFETTQSQLKILGNNVRAAADTLGTELLPTIVELSQEFGDFLNKPETQTAIKNFGVDLAGGIRNVIAELKGADFSSLISGMKTAADVAKGAFDLFNKLPPDIKALAIGALVVNKATGGAVGSIAKGLTNIVSGTVGGLLTGGGLLGRGSSPAHPVWVASATGGIGGPGGLLPSTPLGLLTALGGAALIAGTIALIYGAEGGFDTGPGKPGRQARAREIILSPRSHWGGLPEALRGNTSAIEINTQALAREGGGGTLTGTSDVDRERIARGLEALDPARERRARGLSPLPDTAFGPEVASDFAELPHITERLGTAGQLLRDHGVKLDRIFNKPTPNTNLTIPISVNVNASLIASQIYQISTSARLREG